MSLELSMLKHVSSQTITDKLTAIQFQWKICLHKLLYIDEL